MQNQSDTLSPVFLKEAFKKGVEILLIHRDEINALNVFPVPDGDTGSNMSACVLEAMKELDKISFNSMKNVAEAIRTGTLMGARGNSGVILSQIFSGFCATITRSHLVTLPLFAEALEKGSEVAKSAVMKPVRGTILTLIEDLAHYSSKIIPQITDFSVFFDLLTKRSFRLVEKTREMMPKLKQAGVVDAGAKGLAYIIEGFYRYSIGEKPNIPSAQKRNGTAMMPQFARETLTFQYCTEFMVKLFDGVENGYVKTLKGCLGALGDSMVIVQDRSILKGHIHTDHPGDIFENVLKYGELMKVKVDNMKEQHESLITEVVTVAGEVTFSNAEEVGKPDETYNENGVYIENPEPDSFEVPFIDLETGEMEMVCEEEIKENGFIAISPGTGISRLFKDLNVDQVVFGGQTMNPSTADIANAIEKVKAKNVFVLPNNPNIILAAISAAKMLSNGKSQVFVVETKSIQEGIAAILGFSEIDPPLINLQNMNLAREEIISISVTHAVRDSEIEDAQIFEGEFLFFSDKNLIDHGRQLNEVILSGLQKLETRRFHTLNIYFGSDIQEQQAQDLQSILEQQYPDMEIEVFKGDQPHYPYLFSLE